MADELFDLRNNFTLGNFQAAINDAVSLRVDDSDLQIQRDFYLYRAYIAQGEHDIVLDEVKDDSAVPLQAVRLLATYLSKPENQDLVMETLKQWLSEGVAANPQLQLVAGIIYCNEGNFDEALRCLNQCDLLEAKALMVQIYIEMNRLDFAQKELASLQQRDDDATITQLACAWVNTAIGQEKIQEAHYVYQDLRDKYGNSPVVLNGLAVCALQQHNYPEAETCLLDALEKNSKAPEVLSNLVVCYRHLNKNSERYLRQLNAACENHWLVKELNSAAANFDKASMRFAT